MPGIFDLAKNLFIYKEPSNTGRFELLESEPEETGQPNQEQKPVNNNAAPPPQEAPKETKLPFKLNKWIKTKDQSAEDNGQFDATKVNESLEINLRMIKDEFNIPINKDVIIREFTMDRNTRAFIVYVEGMADRMIINDFILRQLMAPFHFKEFKQGSAVQYITDNVLSVNDTANFSDIKTDIVPKILNGSTGLFIDGCTEALLIETRGYEKRAVEKPVTEMVIHGSQEGFTENLRTNITLLRKIIRNKDLTTELLPIGDRNHLTCAVMYIKGLTNIELVEEVKRRIASIKTDYILGDGMLEQFIEDQPFALLPQVFNTERPDRAASFLMGGQVIIIADGTPFAITVPVTFWRLLYTTEDSNTRWQYGTVLRLIRLFGLLASVFLPGMYVALVLYHHAMVPTELLASIAFARENVPFPTMIEILLMEVSFSLIQEAGVRVPGVIGGTIGIIGALILGQAAVAANIVSPILIIIVSLTGLGSYAIPSYSLTAGIRIMKFIFIFLGGALGFYGISAGIFLFGCMLCNMKSFGVPYMVPFAPKVSTNTPLPVARPPIWKEEMRGDEMNTQDRRRQAPISRGWIKNKKGGSNK